MPGHEYEKTLELATDQHGYLTTAQAQQLGIGRDTIRKMAKRGTLHRVSWGVYRLPTFPVSTFAEYMEACLWPAGVRGVISHESALAMRDLSDVNPPKVRITVPRTFRVRRAVPRHMVIPTRTVPTPTSSPWRASPRPPCAAPSRTVTARTWVRRFRARPSKTESARGTSSPTKPVSSASWSCHEPAEELRLALHRAPSSRSLRNSLTKPTTSACSVSFGSPKTNSATRRGPMA